MKDRLNLGNWGVKIIVLALIVSGAYWLTQIPSKVQAAGIIFVQSRSTDCGAATTCSLAYTSNNATGNLLVLALRVGAVGRTITVTDTRGNSYTLAATRTDTADGHQSYIYYVPNSLAGANTITVGISNTAVPIRFAIFEYSGADQTAPLDVTATNEGNGTTNVSTGSATTTLPGELILGFATTGNVSTFTQGSGFTMRATTTKVAVEEQIQSAAGAVNATFTLGSADNFAGILAAFKPTSGGTPPPPPPPPAFDFSISNGGNKSVVRGSAVTNTITSTLVSGSSQAVSFSTSGLPSGATAAYSPTSCSPTCSTTLTITTTAATPVATSTITVTGTAGTLTHSTNFGLTVNAATDTTPPTGTIVINNDDAATNNRTVTLTLSATDDSGSVTQMRISNTTTAGTAESYATTKTWTLANSAGTKTVFVQFKDAAGNWSGNFSDTIVYDTTAPTISSVAKSNITNNSATITWTTNEPATSQVEYGTTTSYGSLTAIDNTLVTSHNVSLTGLASSQTYNFRARSKDAAGNEKLGTNTTLTTLAGPDTTPPSVPAGLAGTVLSSTQINLSWNASTDNVGVTGYNLFRDGIQIASQAGRTFSDTGRTPNTTYAYQVAARDAAGNVSTLSGVVNVATPAFVTSNVQVTNITSNHVTVTWTTDQPATSAVELGPTSAYGSITAEDTTLVLNHIVQVSGLTANTTYHFRTHSADANDVHGFSPDGVFSTLPAGTTGTFQNEILVTGLDFPDSMEFLPDGTMLVSELSGTIKRVLPGHTQAETTPFLAITNLGRAGGLQGLFDIELDPNFATNHYIYAFYTLGSPNYDRLSRFTASADNTSASLASEFVIYQDTIFSGTDHHGGAIAFGNDGKLYVTIGEHADSTYSQNLASSRGKVLRYNPDGTVPTDNPFYDGAGPNYDAIWAYGFRNPFRMFVDKPTGRIFVADVGGNNPPTAREEVNLLSRGTNYSWPNCEGVCGTVDPGDPIYDYSHFVPGSNTQTRDASITGGFIYRGSQFPASYQGNYFFGDYTQNWIRRLTFDASGNAVTGMQYFEPIDGSLDAPIGAVVCLVQGPEGSLYYCDLGWENESTLTGGKIRRIKFVSNNQPPQVTSTATPLTGIAPLTVNFSSTGTNDPDNQPSPLTYAWDFGDGTNSTLANPAHTYSNNGQYVVRLSVSDGETSTLGDPIAIRVGNPPVATISSPIDGSTFRAGDVINFSGDGSDPDDGALPDSAFTWKVDFLHDGHIHPGATYTGVRSGSFTIATTGHDYQGNTRYRVQLTVTDLDGLQTTTSVIVWPQKVNLTFNTSPAGKNITIDGITQATPLVYDTLIGFNHVLGAPNQSDASNVYTFASWSDGGAQTHTLVVPTTNTTYTANFSASPNNATPTYVQRTEINSTTNTNVVTVPAFTNAVGNGNLFALWIWYNSSSQNVSSITDNKGNGYIKAVGPTGNVGGGWRQELWYAKNVVGGTGVSVTVTFTGAIAGEKAISVHEYSGLDPVSPLDATSSFSGVAANTSSGQAATSYARELIFGASWFASSGTAGSGFTQRSGQNGNATEDKFVTTAGSNSASFTNTSQDTIVQMMTFKVAGQ
jgi:glucose/arabinose dehydrogenase